MILKWLLHVGNNNNNNTSILRTKQLWLSVLLKDTSASTGQAGIQTHILTMPELESNALDRSATTLRVMFVTTIY